ncbi:MAG: hypothetical protein KGZ50_00310 [Peptococcaceae bacterium]|nr:hypothetical protein [Peptococcaceae bacterium]
MPAHADAMNPRAWPQWSSPQEVASGNGQFGFRSTIHKDGSIVVATVNFTADALLITAIGQEPQQIVPVKNLVSYTISSLGSETAVAWSERTAGRSTLWLQIGTKPRIVAWQGEGFITDVAATGGADGRLYVTWAGGKFGAEGIHLTILATNASATQEPVRLTAGGAMDHSPRLTISGAYAHLNYRRDLVLYTEIRYRRINLDDLQGADSIKIGDTGRESNNLPLLAPNVDGSADVYWLRSTVLRGRARGSSLVMGQVGPLGNWTRSLTPLLEQEGHNLHLSIARSETGVTVLTWLNDATSTWQAHFLSLDKEGQLLTSGPVTQSSGNKFSPAVHANGTWHVLYYELRGDMLRVMQVDNQNVPPMPFVVRLGLDPEFPLLDAFYTFVSAMAGALALTVIAALPILMLVLLCHRCAGQLTALLGLVASFNILLRLVGGTYIGSFLVPGWGGFAIMLGSALFSYGFVYHNRPYHSDMLTIGAFAFLYAFCLFFISLLVKSAGQPDGQFIMYPWLIDLAIGMLSVSALFCSRSANKGMR